MTDVYNFAARAIDIIGQDRFIIHTSYGEYTGGVWKETARGTTRAQGKVTPASSAEMYRLPEGLRQSAAIRIVTRSKLVLAEDGQQADQVEWDGERYEVSRVNAWTSGRGGDFYDAICVRVEP